MYNEGRLCEVRGRSMVMVGEEKNYYVGGRVCEVRGRTMVMVGWEKKLNYLWG